MSTLVKRLLITFLAIIALFVVALIAAYFLIDAESFKQKLIAEVNSATGRELTINGDLDISLFPQLGLSANNISLSNAKGFSEKPFASLSRAEFGIKLIPVFSKEIEADTITLHGLKLYLGVNKQGVSNWADLTGEESTDSSATQSSSNSNALNSLSAFSIGGIDISDAEIIWDDQQTPQKFSISNFDLNSGAILPGKPVSLTMGFNLDSQPKLIDGNIELKGTANIDLANKLVAISDFSFNSTLNGPALPTQAIEIKLNSDISLDIAKDTLSLQNLAFNTLDVHAKGQLTANQLSSAPQFKGHLNIDEFSLRELLEKLGVTIETADPNVLAKTSLNIDFTGSTNKLSLTSLGAKLDDTQLNGNLIISEFSKPNITAKLKLDKIDLDRYLPPSEEENATAASTTASAPSSGGDNGTASSNSTNSDAAADNSWMHPLRTLLAKAQFDVGSLKINQLTLTQLATTLTAKGGLVTLHPLTASLYNGNYQGHIQLNSNLDTPIISVNETLKGVAIGPLLKDLTGDDKIIGTANAKAKLTMRGSTPEQIKKTANGDIQFSFINGAVKGVNLSKIIRDAKAKLAGKSTSNDNEPQQTDFAELSGSANIKSGLLQNQDLLMKSPFFRVNGRGKANLINESVDYLTEVSIVETSKGQGGKGLADLKGLTIPVKISGTFTNPKFKPDLKSLISDSAKQKAKEKIDKQKGRFKGKLLDKLGVKSGAAASGDSSTTESTAPEEKLEDKLKNKFKGLF
ncbi:MAG: AsmA family protein [Gammaproteobacteria bacterium]|nr:AsmA family protein [Gammaproteobacteria bacterium]